MSTRPVILCFSGDVWDGLPHSRHHLMRRLTARYDVVFIEGMPMRGVAFSDRQDWRRVLTKVRAGRHVRTVEDGLHVVRPLPVPPVGRLGAAAQLASLQLEIRLAIRRYKLDGPRLAWFSQPLAAPLLGRLGERASLLYYQDRYDAFQHVDGPRVRTHLAELARRCELSIASADPLADELRVLGADPIVLHHGVEVDRFATPAPAPGDLAELERPLVGFVGLIEPYLDLGAIVKVADSLERGTVVLVGDVNVDRRLLDHERIALLGRRDYALMPAYLQAFQVCLLPFKMDRLTEAVDPLKLREYLAAGRPVVSTPLPSVLPYAPVIKLASGPLEFAAAVRSALEPGEDSSEARARRRARVAGESWDEVAAHLETLIEPLMNRRA